MLASLSILAVGAALTSVASADLVFVDNNCPFNVSVWAMGGIESPVTYLQHGERFSEKLHRDPVSGGRDIKVTRDADQLSGPPRLQLSYNVVPDGNSSSDISPCGWLVYDINPVFGTPLRGNRVTLESGECPNVIWPNGVKTPYSFPWACWACWGLSVNLTLTLCASA
ncbi:hypothetical protein G6O67_008639 [Ophiocordyceps sinensis]|uniref:Bys1 family protein n=2 Tax=Ophiocordyceps sinensis TaxID=72228 RepID=A0A8H4LS95_9HYPO|nr:Bys1 family protein [Ophiocordyceps sinensis CO18]KAF4504017.1 hypothetical protein G6O67_008639 [Ophiocordyceps sinensis]